jgi:hypothetical protein
LSEDFDFDWRKQIAPMVETDFRKDISCERISHVVDVAGTLPAHFCKGENGRQGRSPRLGIFFSLYKFGCLVYSLHFGSIR